MAMAIGSSLEINFYAMEALSTSP